jgi:pimeloyl-ACP methyl ester carboxylesterase
VLAYAASIILTARRKPDQTDSPQNHGLKFETVYFPSTDGLILEGWWIPTDKVGGTVILCHGQNGSMDADIDAAKTLYDAGFNVFMFNFRAHGRSQGEYVTFGWFEEGDLHGAIDYLARQHNINEVGVLGFSMGSIVAIRTAGLNDSIKCVVADGAIGRLHNTLIRWLMGKGIPSWLATPFTWAMLWMGGQRTGASMTQINTVRWAAQMNNCPTLFIHGGGDNLVPIADVEDLVANAPIKTKLWIVPGCKHREVHLLYPDEYNKRIVTWFSDHLTL